MSEDAKALSMIRQITDRYVGHGYDNRDLEACFDDIMKEERRSARIAREEDEMEAKLIAEEEERERQRKLLRLSLSYESLFEVSNGYQRRRLSSSCDRAVEMLFSFFYDSSCGARDYSKLRNLFFGIMFFQGTETVLGIYFNASALEEAFSMDEKSFEGMRNLQFLIVRDYVGYWVPQGRLLLPQGLFYIPRKLRLLRWDAYPSKCLPSNFKAEYLVELRMKNSSLEKLWEGTLPLGRLKKLIMSWSTYLKELPDLSNAKSLEEVYLDRCTSLATFPSSIQNLHKLRELDLEGCTELESFPILINLKSLDLEVEGCFWNNCLCGLDYLGCIMRCIPCKFRPATCLRSYGKASRYCVCVFFLFQCLGSLEMMDVSTCENLTEIPDLSMAPNLLYLRLNNCKSLVTVPSTIGNLFKLVKLEMEECTMLEVLPTDVNLPSLETLHLSGCSRLKSFPQISRSIANLYLNDTAIEDVPCCIENFWRLSELSMCGCKRLENISPNIFRLRSLKLVDFSDCGEVVTALSDASILATISIEDHFSLIPLFENTEERYKDGADIDWAGMIKGCGLRLLNLSGSPYEYGQQSGESDRESGRSNKRMRMMVRTSEEPSSLLCGKTVANTRLMTPNLELSLGLGETSTQMSLRSMIPSSSDSSSRFHGDGALLPSSEPCFRGKALYCDPMIREQQHTDTPFVDQSESPQLISTF
ncbi:BnaC07g33980D [Brassica napus]|uniref:BnaC07g33980D protein n=1 Tax=Brassica napus TaxID=3708 RepID=A0A078FCB3_BRANA|nr:BnaC07g33980D [Brassica napus]